MEILLYDAESSNQVLCDGYDGWEVGEWFKRESIYISMADSC